MLSQPIRAAWIEMWNVPTNSALQCCVAAHSGCVD